MFWANVYTRHEFNSESKASEGLDFLGEWGGVFAPTHYGFGEPVRRPYISSKRDEPIRLLSGAPQYEAGAIFLKGKGHDSLSVLRWLRAEVSKWEFYLSSARLREPTHVIEFVRFLTELCRRFQIIFGWAAPEEDWDAKHWRVESVHGRSSIRRKLGSDLIHGLPGIYWLTIFGSELAQHFGKSALTGLPVHETIDLHHAGTVLVTRKSPFEPELKDRLQQDRAIMQKLGSQYFFDIEDPNRRIVQILGAGGVTGTKENTPGLQPTLDPAEAFEYIEVRTLEGDLCTDLDYLAEMLVVYLHSEVKPVYEYSRNALVSVDSYFSQHPQASGYSTNFLMKEFIPALGAYLGQVIVNRLDGKWLIQEPIMRSCVVVANRRVSPFRHAYKCVYQGERLAGLYEEAERLVHAP